MHVEDFVIQENIISYSWCCYRKIEGIPDNMPLCEACCEDCINPHILKEYLKHTSVGE